MRSERFDFFFNDTATTEIYTLSLHDALPICIPPEYWCGYSLTLRSGLAMPTSRRTWMVRFWASSFDTFWWMRMASRRSEEHTSELQSRQYLVCRLLLEKNIHLA